MVTDFAQRLAALRKERKLSQRRAAADFGISQALMSHYENGAREPGLDFVCRACDYYGVTADYLLGRENSSSVMTGARREALLVITERLARITEDLEDFTREQE